MKWRSFFKSFFSKLFSSAEKDRPEERPRRSETELLALVEKYQEAIRRNPQDGMGHYNLGEVYIELGRFKESLQPLKESIRINPKHRSAHYQMGRAFVELSRDDDAIPYLEEALSYDATSAAARRWLTLAHTQISVICRKTKQIKESIQHVKEAVRLTPDYGPAHLSMGLCYAELANYQEALNKIEYALSLDKTLEVDAHYESGIIYGKLGDHKRAIKEYKAACAAEPKAPLPQLRLGLLYAKLGRDEEAVKPLQAAVKLSPRIAAEGFFKLGALLNKLGRHVEAVEPLRQAHKISPGNQKVNEFLAEALYRAGNAHAQSGDKEMEVAALKEAVEFNPQHVMAHYRLGLAYDKVQQGYYAIHHMTIAKLFFVEKHEDEFIAKAIHALNGFYKKYPYGPEDFKKVKLPQ